MDRAFEAPDLIEVMDEAVNYNRFLIDELVAWGTGARRILDFGAGNGRFALALADRGLNVAAIEPDVELRRSIREAGVETFESLDAVAESSFDAIYSVNVLEHIEADEEVLAAFASKLEPGGRLFTYVPAFDLLYSQNDRRVGHVRRYRRGQLVSRLERAGFRVKNASYVDSIGFAAALLYKAVGDSDGGLNVGAVRFYDSVAFPLSRVIDRLAGRLFGKNLLVLAVRD